MKKALISCTGVVLLTLAFVVPAAHKMELTACVLWSLAGWLSACALQGYAER